jgi:hypothetical protein
MVYGIIAHYVSAMPSIDFQDKKVHTLYNVAWKEE